MQPFRRFDRATYLLIGLLVVSFALTTLDVRGEQSGLGEVLRSGAQTVFSPLQKAATAVTRPVVGFIDAISNFAGLREENERLRQQLADLQAGVQEVEELRLEVELLQQAAGLDVPGDLAAVTARIFANGVTDFDRVRFISRGSDDGLAKGQAVIDARTGGLVGIVDQVADDSARVRLITDTRVGVGVRNLTSSETGWVEGRGSDPMQLEMFSVAEPVTEGDLLVTNGSRYPPDIPVGVVLVSAEAEAGFGLFSTVRPIIDLGRLDYVKVIVGWSPLDAALDNDGDEVVPNPSVDLE
ncbi:MAG: rod shape-determining protein MreC [Acidimicrobiia bacterium]|nr:rod shape-determining protein MreC [Acidimicrobiia bacterium]